jgi:hypothetical protein
MLQGVLTLIAAQPFLIAGYMTVILLYVAAGIGFHRLCRGFFIARWLFWSEVVFSILATLVMLSQDIARPDEPSSPLAMYEAGVARGLVCFFIWPMLWMLGIWGGVWAGSVWFVAAVLVSPAVVLLIGAAIADNVPRRLRQRLSRHVAHSTIGE